MSMSTGHVLMLDSTNLDIIMCLQFSDINAFLSSHTVEEAVENLEQIKSELFKHVPGGVSNIKAMFLKATNTVAVPLYIAQDGDANAVKVPSNMTEARVKRTRRITVKRLKKQALNDKKKKKKAEKNTVRRNKAAAQRSLLVADGEHKPKKPAAAVKSTAGAKTAAAKPVSKVTGAATKKAAVASKTKSKKATNGGGVTKAKTAAKKRAV